MLGYKQKYIKVNWSSPVICPTDYLFRPGLAIVAYSYVLCWFTQLIYFLYIFWKLFQWQALFLPANYQLDLRSALRFVSTTLQYNPVYNPVYNTVLNQPTFLLYLHVSLYNPVCSPYCRLLKMNIAGQNHCTSSQSSWFFKNGCYCFIHLKTSPNLWRLLGVPSVYRFSGKHVMYYVLLL